VTTNIELAKKISKHVDLLLVTLRKADIRADFDPFEIPDDMELTQKYRCGYDTSTHADNGRLAVFVELAFSAREKGEITNEESTEVELGSEVVALDATFLLVYALDSSIDLDPKCVEHFANVNGPYNVWPYWRELVQTAAGRVGLGNITVPVFRPPVFEINDNGEAAIDE
jgi:hypothetical protein